MNKKIIKDLSASTVQVILNQVLGLLIFIIISRYLNKSIYGELNWSLAILTFVTTILSLRLEQVIVRNVASGDDPSKMLTLFCGHIFFSGILFYLVLLIAYFLFPVFFDHHSLLLILAISQLLSFFSTPFKHLAAGKEKYNWLAVMSLTANLVRSVWLVIIVLLSSINIRQVLVVYIVSSLAELLVSIYIMHKRMHIKVSAKWMLKDYFILINKSLPQVGVVFLNACIARMDWILLGIFSTQIVTAEYSFAYKIFELSPIPILIIGPILLTRFSGYFKDNPIGSLALKQAELSFFIRAEMILATFLPLLLNIAWAPLIDTLTQNKYGAVNKTTFLLLSFCIPFQYLINLFWTIHFTQNHLALIFRITAVTCAVLVAGNVLMIPVMNANGAAVAYLLSMIVEYILYFRSSSFICSRDKWLPLVLCITIALVSGYTVEQTDLTLIGKLTLSSVMYCLLLLITGQLRKEDVLYAKQWFSRQTKYGLS